MAGQLAVKEPITAQTVFVPSYLPHLLSCQSLDRLRFAYVVCGSMYGSDRQIGAPSRRGLREAKLAKSSGQSSGRDYVELLKADGLYDGHVPVHDENDGVDYWIAENHLRSMLKLYFPHGPDDAPRLTDGRYLVVLLLHSALETLAQDMQVPRRAGESVVAAISRHLYSV